VNTCALFNLIDSIRKAALLVVTVLSILQITWTNFTGTTLAAGQFCCLAEAPCTELYLDNVVFHTALGYGSCQHAVGSASGTVQPSIAGCLTPTSELMALGGADVQWSDRIRAHGRAPKLMNALCPKPQPPRSADFL
jgi:hypothetical protein